MEKTKETAALIIEKIGGTSNIANATHCATRLRLELVDDTKVNDEEVKAIPGVLGVVRAGGQYQTIIGPGVSKVYEAVQQQMQVSGGAAVLASPAAAADDSVLSQKEAIDKIKNKNKENIVNRVSRMLMNVVYPLVPTMAALGVMKGLLAIFVTLGVLQTTDGTYQIISGINDAFLYFMPIMIAVSCAKYTGANVYTSAAIGATLVLPALVEPLSDGTLTFLGLHVPAGTYGNSLFPVLIAILLSSQLEKLLGKYIPEALEFIKLMITALIMVPVTLFVIGPVFSKVGELLAAGTMGIYGLSPLLAGVLFGAFWQVCVMFGIHYAFIPILTEITLRDGSNALSPILGMGVWALAGACLGFALKVRDKNKKSIAFSAFTSGIFGITEPAIYGVALPERKPFVCAMIAGGLAGPFCYLLHVEQFTPAAVGGILTFGAHMNPNGDPTSLIGWFITFLISFALSAVMTYFTTNKEA